MNYNATDRVEEILEEGYSVRIGDYLRRGYEIFRQNAGGYIGFLLLTMLITTTAQIIPLVGIIISTLILSPALMLGNYLVANKIASGQRTEFNEFFKGFEHIGQLAAYTLVFLLFMLLIFSPLLYSAYNSGIFEWYSQVLTDPTNPPTDLPDFSGSFFGMFGLVMIPYLYLALSYIFTPMYIGIYKMGFWEAMETSRKVVGKNWFGIFGLSLAFVGVVMLIAITGGLLVGLGSFAHWSIAGLLGFALAVFIICISPVFYTTLYAAFEDIMQLNTNNDPQDELLDHLVD